MQHAAGVETEARRAFDPRSPAPLDERTYPRHRQRLDAYVELPKRVEHRVGGLGREGHDDRLESDSIEVTHDVVELHRWPALPQRGDEEKNARRGRHQRRAHRPAGTAQPVPRPPQLHFERSGKQSFINVLDRVCIGRRVRATHSLC